jgi:hypothetical protein
MFKYCRLYFVLIALWACTAHGQTTAIDWLQNSSTIVDTTKHVHVNLSMKVIAGTLNGELLETNNGSYRKAGDKVYTNFGPLISVQKNGQSILIDKLNTSIYYTQFAAASKPTANYLSLYKELKPYLDTFYIAASNESYIDLVCKYKQAIGVMYSRIDTRIAIKTALPEKINIYMNEGMPFYEDELKGRKPIISIEYNNWQLNSPGDFSVFDFDKYLVKKDNTWIGVGEYKNYEITTLY